MLEKTKSLRTIPQLKDSISYLYIEHAIIEQDNWAICNE